MSVPAEATPRRWHMMLDLETLGTDPDAAIVQVAAVLFDPRPGGMIHPQTFSAYVRAARAEAVSTDTVAWWLGLPAEARERLAAGLGTAESECEALHLLNIWARRWGGGVSAKTAFAELGALWAYGTHFDVAILGSAFARQGSEAPWSHRLPRDVRTLYAIAGKPDVAAIARRFVEVTSREPVEHDALDDCVLQAIGVQIALGAIRDGDARGDLIEEAHR